MSTPIPEIGSWYQTVAGDTLEVVAWDREEQTIEVQFYDGTVEEYDVESWAQLGLTSAEPPEDWSGSMDVSGDDYGVDLDRPAGDHPPNPFDELDLNEH